jgi:hypothetical protein
MRRRRSRLPWRLLASCWGVLGAGRAAHAQTGNPVEGALEFLLPMGARAIAMGKAVAASATGTDALWWNPALIARGPREAAFGVVGGEVALSTDVSVALVYPIRHALSLGLSFRYIDQGEGEGIQDDQQTGSYVPSTRIAAATFAAPFGDRLALGLSVKLLSVNFSVTGQVPNVPDTPPITGAIDLGAQYIVTKDSLFVVGAAVTNLGPSLQINDSPQADPLPGRVDVGVQLAPKFPAYPYAAVRLAADLVERTTGVGGPGFRLGGEASWMGQYHARAGYALNGPTGSGPSVGAGVSFARWRADFAQFLSGADTGVGDKLTYLSIRYAF